MLKKTTGKRMKLKDSIATGFPYLVQHVQNSTF